MMKKTFTLIAIMLLLATQMFAQKLSYQAVIRNSNNELVYNATLTVEVSILGPSQNVLYSQTIQNVTSNQNGLITIQIGDDSPAWRAINWSDATIRSVIKDGTTTVATVNSAVSAVPLAIQTLNGSNGERVQADWEETDQNSPAFIQNKPTIPTALDMSGYVTTEQLQNAGYLSQEADPTVPAWAKEQTKPTYSYNEITGTPTIPTVNNGVLTITQGDSSYTFSANTDQNVAVTLPQIPEMPSMDDIAGAMGNMGFLRYETQTLSDVAAHGNDAGSRQLKGLADPTDAQDAVTLSYLMEQVNNLQQQLNRLSQVVADQQAVIDSLTNGGGNGGDTTVVPTAFTCGDNLIDGNNSYTTHQYGSQCWMTQNLRNASGTGNLSYPDVLQACPTGWHLPSNDDWGALGNSLPSSSVDFGDGDYWTTNGTMPWEDDQGHAFTLVVAVAGVRSNSYSIIANGIACEANDAIHCDCKFDAYCVSFRCVREETGGSDTTGGPTTAQAPSVTSSSADLISENEATLFAYVSNPDNVTVTSKGFEYKVSGSANYTTAECYVNSQDDNGFGIYAPLTGLTAGTEYTYRAFVTTAEGTSYGSEGTFTTTSVDTTTFNCGTSTIQDIDGNVYNTVQIGHQCWMRDNLRTTHYSDGTPITLATPSGSHMLEEPPYYYDDANSEISLEKRGYYYNLPAVMHGADFSDANPSGVQGPCPMGWHVPSDSEWGQLMQTTVNKPESLGFPLTLAGALYATTFERVGEMAFYWTSSYGGEGWNSYYQLAITRRYYFSYWDSNMGSPSDAYSVRCVRDENGGSTAQIQPFVTSSSADLITENTATLFAKVSNPDSVTVTSKGFEYKVSGSANYTTVNGYENYHNGTVFGIYAPLYNLTAGTEYTYRAFVTTAEGTIYGSEGTFTTTSTVPTTSASVGDILLEDNSWVSPNDFDSTSMTAKGVIFHVDETGQHGWAVNLHNENEGYALAWSVYNQGGVEYNVDVEDLPNYTSYDAALSDTAGYQNTTAIRLAMDYQIFHVASQVNIMEGWYVPACGQVAVLMQNLTNVNSSLVTVNGTEIPTKWIWSSTEYGSDRAWGWDEEGMYNPLKLSGYRVRSIRSF